MGKVIHFKRPALAERTRGNTLCRNGHHKWVLCKNSTFDVKQGRLVTLHQCSRCKATKNRAQ